VTVPGTRKISIETVSKVQNIIFFEPPTTKAVGLFFVTYSKTADLVAGIPSEINIAKKNPDI
jgi:hypothetical protein